MSLIRINKNPNGRQLLVFALAWLVFLGLAGLVSQAKGRHLSAEIAWGAALALPLAGVLWRGALRYAYLGLSHATYPIGFVVSHAALLIVYYLVLTPLGLTMRLFRYDPLSRKFDPAARSYWAPREKAKPAESYLNQN